MIINQVFNPRRPCRISTGLIWVLLATLLGTSGCWRRNTKADIAEDSLTGALSMEDIHVSLQEFLVRYSARIRIAADRIAHGLSDSHIQRRTVKWKLMSIEYGRESSHQREPLPALLDTWALCLQMRNYFVDGIGKDLFLEQTGVARAACQQNLDDIRSLVARILPDERFESAHEVIVEFAADNPMDESFTRRAARITAEHGRTNASLDWLVSTSMIPFRAIGGIDYTAQAIFSVSQAANEATVVASLLPEQVRWQAQLLLFDIESNPSVKSALTSMESFATSAEDLNTTARELPGTLRHEIVAVLKETEQTQKTLQETLRETRDTLGSVQTALDSVEKTSTDLSRAGTTWQAAFQTLWDMINDFAGDPDAPPTPPEEQGAPYDINDYAKTADNLAQAAVELRDATRELRNLVASDDLRKTVDIAEGAVSHILWLVTALCLVVIFGVLVAAITYRLMNRRIGARAALKTETKTGA